MRKFVLLFSFFISSSIVFSQDSVTVSPYLWKAIAKKISDGNFEISFITNGAPGWQLYAPNQVFNDVKAAELVFPDSSITSEEKFAVLGEVKTVKSVIFENTDVKIYEQACEWKATVHIK